MDSSSYAIKRFTYDGMRILIFRINVNPKSFWWVVKASLTCIIMGVTILSETLGYSGQNGVDMDEHERWTPCIKIMGMAI